MPDSDAEDGDNATEKSKTVETDDELSDLDMKKGKEENYCKF